MNERDLQDDYRRLLARIEANDAQFRRLGRSVWRVQEDERRRLARELHDGIGQNLTALKHRLALIGSGLGAEHATLRSGLEAAIALCSATLEDTRQLSRMLRPPILDDLGLVPALRWLARTVTEAGGPEVELAIDELPPLDAEFQTLLFRLAQEAFNNAVKHADARHLRLALTTGAGMLTIAIEDDGRGFDSARPSAAGSGLHGMRERIRLHGGAFELVSAPGAGTRLSASVPLDGA